MRLTKKTPHIAGFSLSRMTTRRRSDWRTRGQIGAGLAHGALSRLHDLRHAFASHALAGGLSAHAVAALLGHSDAGLVWRRYGHALPDEVARAGEVLSAWRAAER